MKKDIIIQDKKSFEQKVISPNKLVIGVIISANLLFGLGYLFGKIKVVSKINRVELVSNDNKIFMSKQDLLLDYNEIDSAFVDYERRANLWLSRNVFKGTPITGGILTLAAKNAYDSTGILVPVELALAQAQWESSMGRKGRSPANNPFNIGEYDNGTVKWYNSTFEGVQAYYYQVCRTYLKCSDLDELFVNYVNCDGRRYASKKTYEKSIKSEYYNIKNWLDAKN